MRPFKLIITAILYFVVVSCDHTTYVAVRNYKEPCRVLVTYEKSGNTIIDHDSLKLRNINSTKIHSLIVRTNTSLNSYLFIAPGGKETGLMPQSLGQPIKQVEIFNTTDSPWIIHLWERKEYKKLKKSGQITTKGFIFTTEILINNGFEK